MIPSFCFVLFCSAVISETARTCGYLLSSSGSPWNSGHDIAQAPTSLDDSQTQARNFCFHYPCHISLGNFHTQNCSSCSEARTPLFVSASSRNCLPCSPCSCERVLGRNGIAHCPSSSSQAAAPAPAPAPAPAAALVKAQGAWAPVPSSSVSGRRNQAPAFSLPVPHFHPRTLESFAYQSGETGAQIRDT